MERWWKGTVAGDGKKQRSFVIRGSTREWCRQHLIDNGYTEILSMEPAPDYKPPPGSIFVMRCVPVEASGGK